MFKKKDLALIKKLNTPAKIQDYLNTLPFNFEKKGETIKSPTRVLKEGNKSSIHCMEGALLGAYLLSLFGHKPLLLHLKTTKDDFDHVIAPFVIDGLWGALSKTNHAVLRYREPVYKNLRELVMSYFHEYFLNSNGKKTLRAYSVPLNLNIYKNKSWWEDESDLWYIDEKLDQIKHFDIATKNSLNNLRKADKIERKIGHFVEFTP